MYSQNNEEQVILDYFKDFSGSLLDIGANDGVTFSNSLALIERGWNASLVEPSPSAFSKLSQLHSDNSKVKLYQFAIGATTQDVVLHVNDPHIPNDDSLLATTKASEMNRWGSLKFNETKVEQFTFNDAFEGQKFDFITIDAEGVDLEVLQQINLVEVGCKLVCVEHNGNKVEEYRDYCAKYGMKEIAINAENIIMAL